MDGVFCSITELRSVREKTIKHYNSSHRILLAGEGDFSFSACLATAFGSAASMVATSLDSKESLLRKYSRVAGNLEVLEELGGTVLHGVDATMMSLDCCLSHKEFDRIVFNFPHAGFPYKEQSSLQINLHRDLVRDFLWNAKEMVSKNGEIHITHKTSHPFNRWEIVELAEEMGLVLKERAEFSLSDNPNYENKRGGRHLPVGACATFKFARTSQTFLFLRHI